MMEHSRRTGILAAPQVASGGSPLLVTRGRAHSREPSRKGGKEGVSNGVQHPRTSTLINALNGECQHFTFN